MYKKRRLLHSGSNISSECLHKCYWMLTDKHLCIKFATLFARVSRGLRVHKKLTQSHFKVFNTVLLWYCFVTQNQICLATTY